MNSRNLALAALKQAMDLLQPVIDANAISNSAKAIAALEAETGEPVATVSISYFRGCKSMENMDFQLSRDLPEGTHNLYAAPPPAVPYSWTVSASGRMWFGDYAEDDAKAEAAHCGGTCKAFPLYKGVPA